MDISVFMMNLILSMFLLTLLFSTRFVDASPPACKASGRVKGKKPPPDRCHEDSEDSFCCIVGRYYNTYKCSPSVSGSTQGVLYLNGFEKGGDGYKPSTCDHNYHSDDTPIVSVSTGWYNGGRRCMKNITISGNGRSAIAMVVDECDSSMGCDADHDYQPPCDNNIVGASKAVWKALGVPLQDWGVMGITWSDA